MEKIIVDIKVIYSRKKNLPLCRVSICYHGNEIRNEFWCSSDVLYAALIAALEDKFSCNGSNGKATFYEDSETQESLIWEWCDLDITNLRNINTGFGDQQLFSIVSKLLDKMADSFLADSGKVLEVKRELEKTGE